MAARRNDPINSRTSTPAYKKMREAVKKRDGYACVVCGRAQEDGFKLEVDHIVRWADGGEDTPDNLRTLCLDHHKVKTREEAANRKPQIPAPSRKWY